MSEITAPPAAMDDLPIRDPSAALALAGGDAALAAELLEALLAGLPEELESLRASLAESDWPGLAEYAHQVRGATRYCGVPALDAALESLERAARASDPPRCADGFALVELQARRLQDQLG